MSWSLLVLLACAATFAFLAVAEGDDVSSVCLSVGALSGCSGCETGTRGLCRYLRKKEGPGLYSFTCVSSSDYRSLVGTSVQSNVYSSGRFMCPSPNAEPTISFDIAPDQNVDGDLQQQWKKRGVAASQQLPAKTASTAYSTTVKSDKTKFPTPTVTVDRSAGTQRLGQMGRQKTGGIRKRSLTATEQAPNLAPLTCENINSARLTTELDEYDRCNAGVAGSYGPAQRVCKSVVHAVWSAYLCPEWGVAISGFCSSLVAEVRDKCGMAGCSALFPWDVYSPSFDMIKSDGTKYCINNVTGVEMSGQYQSAAGFFKSADTLNPVSAVLGTFALTTASVEDIGGARRVLANPLLQISSSTNLYEVLAFDVPSNGKKRAAQLEGKLIQLSNGTSVWEYLTPYRTPWADQVGNIESGVVVFQITGQVYFSQGGSFPISVNAGGAAEIRIGGYQFGWEPIIIEEKRAAQFTSTSNLAEFPSGWMPFEVTGFFDYDPEITISINNTIVGYYNGLPLRTFSRGTPLPAIYTYSQINY